MSKGNMLLGHARGKVGDLVFSRSNGQQVVRARAAVVKNPKTEQQTIQRIILNTVAQGYSKLQPIVNHSFEGVPEGQKSMSKFMHDNLAALRTKVANSIADNLDYDGIVAFTPIGQNVFSPNDFIVSAGSLPSINIESFTTAGAVVALGGVTYEDVINAYGLRRGDQLTFLMVKNGTAGNGSTTFDYARIILDPQTPDGMEAPLSSTLIVDGAVNLPSPRNTGEFESLSITEDGKLTFVLGGAQRLVFSAAVIVSRKSTDGSWLRSNAQLATSALNALGFQNSLQQAIDFSQQNSMESLSELYLNNAGTGKLANVGAAANFGVQVFVGGTSQGGAYLVRFGYQDVETYGKILCGYTAAGEAIAIRNGNDESTWFHQWIKEGAQSYNDWTGRNVPATNGSATFKCADASNEIALWLLNNGYITAAFMSVTSMVQQ